MKRKMKKAVSLFMGTIMLAALVGCGSGKQQAVLPETNERATSTKTIGETNPAGEENTQEVEKQQQEQEPVTITVWRCNMTDERTALCEELNQKFMEKYPWITVEFTSLPDNFNEKLEVSFEAGNAPDVFFQNGNTIAYAKNGYILPLDELYEAWEGKDIMLESAVEAIRSQDLAENKLYFLPEGNNVNCMWIRSDWFLEAGLDRPATWNDLLEDIAALTDTAAGRYGVALRGGSGSASNLEMMMYSYSGIKEAFDEEGSSTINAPENVEFVEKWLVLHPVRNRTVSAEYFVSLQGGEGKRSGSSAD